MNAYYHKALLCLSLIVYLGCVDKTAPTANHPSGENHKSPKHKSIKVVVKVPAKITADKITILKNARKKDTLDIGGKSYECTTEIYSARYRYEVSAKTLYLTDDNGVYDEFHRIRSERGGVFGSWFIHSEKKDGIYRSWRAIIDKDKFSMETFCQSTTE